MRGMAAAVMVVLAANPVAAEEAIEVSRAWTPAPAKMGADTKLFMTIANHGAAPDSLLRARCPVANFTVKYTTDHGEGAPTLREVKTIEVPAGGTVALAPDGYSVMLLQTREALQPGQSFTCTVTFQQAGPREVSVAVAAPDATQAP